MSQLSSPSPATSTPKPSAAWTPAPSPDPSDILGQVYDRLAWHSRGKNVCWPGDATLAKALGLTTLQVSDAITKLWELDRISIEFQGQRRLIHLAKPKNDNGASAPLLLLKNEVVVSSSSSISSCEASPREAALEKLLRELLEKFEKLERAFRERFGDPQAQVEPTPTPTPEAVAEAQAVVEQAIERGAKSGKPVENPAGLFTRALAEGWTRSPEPESVIKQREKARQAAEAVEMREAERAANRALVARKKAFWDALGDDGQTLLNAEAEAELGEAGYHSEKAGRFWPGFLRAKLEELVTRRMATTT